MGDGSSAANDTGAPPSTVPRTIARATLRALDRLALGLIRLGLTANAITLVCVGLAACAGVLLSAGWFGLAAVAMVAASLGDALDGLVARRSGSASVGGALLDASADRYGEFFVLSGLAVYFRASAGMLVLTLFALVGSFMVSYGSAKAEGLRQAVPPGVMRRAERAVCLCLGVALAPLTEWAARAAILPRWVALSPLYAAIGVLAVLANGSALARLRNLARRPRRADDAAWTGATADSIAAAPGRLNDRRDRRHALVR
jgi:CDP-diacylglycerol--glycerol-3-phosphate 3-phosphatidyltransferase